MATADYNPESDLLRHTCSWTPEQRMEWLEQALDFAVETRALEKTRRMEERRKIFAADAAPTGHRV